MKSLLALLAVSIVLAAPIALSQTTGSKEVASNQSEATVPDLDKLIVASEYQACNPDDISCDDDIEHIEIIGRNITPISTSAEGVYTLDKQMLKAYLFGNVNLMMF